MNTSRPKGLKKHFYNSFFNKPTYFFQHEFSPSLLVHDCYFTCTKPTPSKNKPSVKVCGLWIVRVSWHASAVLGHSTIVWQQIYHFQMMQALIWTRQKCCKHGLSNGPDHQQNLKITFLGKVCKDVALSQSYSAKGKRQLLHQVRTGLLSVPAWTRVGYGHLAESSGSSPMHSLLNILAYHRGWSRNYHKRWQLRSLSKKTTETAM